MASSQHCSECGAELPAGKPPGLCTRCLLALALEAAPPSPAAEPTDAPPGPLPQVRTPNSDLRSAIPDSRSPFPPAIGAGQRFGDYELIEEIARGGMGIVYRARQVSLDRIVAVKLLVAGALSSPESVKRFRIEASAAASLQHPNIVAIHEVGIHQGQHYLVMDFIEGASLARVISDFGFRISDFKRCARWVKTVAEAVHYAHEHGILHRDLKPSNVLIDANDQPRVTDFGLAKRLPDKSGIRGPESEMELTLSGRLVGSPSYVPPEQATAKWGKVSRRSDVYGLGAVLYHLLTGRPPFQAATITDTLSQVCTAEPVAPRSLNASLPRDLETICLKCLEKEPGKRYPTAQALAEDLGRYLAQQPVLARPIGPAGKTWRWCRRNTRLAVLGGVALLSVLSGLIGVLWQWRRAEAGELLARQQTYAAEMREAQLALEDDDLQRAWDLLDNHRPKQKSEIARVTPHSPLATDLRGWEWRYLWAQCQGDQRFILSRYTNWLDALAFSPSDNLLAVRLGPAAIDVWNLTTRQRMARIHSRCWYRTLAFSPAGNRLAWGNQAEPDGLATVALWDADTQQIAATLPQPAEATGLAFSPDGTLLTTFNAHPSLEVTNATVNVWRVDTGSLVRQFKASKAWGASAIVRFSPDGNCVAAGETTGRIRLLDWRTGEEKVAQASRENLGVTALAFSPDGRFLAASFMLADFAIRLLDGVTLAPAGVLGGHRRAVSDLVFLPGSQRLISASEDQTIRLWDVPTKTEVHRLKGHLGPVHRISLSPGGLTLASVGRDGTIRVWDPLARPPTRGPVTLPSLVSPYAAAFTRDGRHLITASQEAPVTFWELPNGTETESFPALGTNNLSLALSPDGRWLVVGDWAGSIKVWDCEARQRVTSFAANTLPIYIVGFWTPARDLYSVALELGSPRPTLQRWSPQTWRQLPVGPIDCASSAWLEESPNGRLQAVCHWDGTVKVWDLMSARHITTLPAHASRSDTAAFTPDGRVLATGGRDGQVKFWEVASWRLLDALPANLNDVRSLAFSRDGTRLLIGTGSADEVVVLWHVGARAPLLRLGHGGAYTYFARFSPDGNTLVTMGWFGQADLWRAPSFKEIAAAEKSSEVPWTISEDSQNKAERKTSPSPQGP
jgi:WD40 repeat protein